MLNAQRQTVVVTDDYGPLGGLPFSPVAGADPLPAHHEARLVKAAGQVELLIGYTKHDAAPFVAMDPRAARLARLGPLGRALRSRIVARVTARVFGVEALADTWRQAGESVATYLIDWAPAGGQLGACHCIDLPLLFSGDWSDAPMLAGAPVPADLAAHMRRTWADFATDGVAGLPSGSLGFG